MRLTAGRVVVISLLAIGCSHKGGGGGAGPTPTPTPPAAFCSRDAWCYQNPLAQGETLHAVSALADGTMFAAGDGGEILRFDGTQIVDLSTTAASGSFYGIHAFDASDAIVAGDDGVWWWDGAAWTKDATFPGSATTAVWAAAADDVWVLGDGGDVYQWNGSSWASESIPASGSTVAIDGRSDGDLWVAGTYGVSHRTGANAWTTTDVTTFCTAVAEVSPTDVWAGTLSDGIWHFDGSQWTQEDTTNDPVLGLFALDATHVYAAGESPALRMWNGASWTTLPVAGDPALALFAVDLGAGGDGWVVGHEGQIARITGGKANAEGLYANVGLPDLAGPIASISVVGTGEVWAGDMSVGEVYSFDGANWTTRSTPIGAPQALYAAAHDDVFAGSNTGGAIAHFDGTSWTTQLASGANLRAMWGSGHSDVYAVGAAGTVEHYDGSNWTPAAAGVTSNELFSVWGTGAGDVYAVGRHGTVLHESGGSWTKIDAGVVADLYGVWVGSATDVWIAGDGVLLGGNATDGFGVELLPSSADASRVWRAIWGTSATDLWAASQGGALLHRDATGWHDVASPTHLDLYSIAGTGKDVWASGKNLAILHHRAP